MASFTAFRTVPSTERITSNGLLSGAMTGDFVRMKSISSRAAVVARSPRKAISTVPYAGMFKATEDSILAITLKDAEPAYTGTTDPAGTTMSFPVLFENSTTKRMWSPLSFVSASSFITLS